MPPLNYLHVHVYTRSTTCRTIRGLTHDVLQTIQSPSARYEFSLTTELLPLVVDRLYRALDSLEQISLEQISLEQFLLEQILLEQFLLEQKISFLTIFRA